MISTGTIVAVASAPGRAPRAVVRVSGPATPALVASIADAPFTRGARRVELTLDVGRVPAILFCSPAPGSYTGEDAAEFLVVGAPHVVAALCDALESHDGVRPAGPGEFSLRAHLSGRLTLDEAEGVAATISAISEEDAAAARRLLSGEGGAEARGWVERLARLLALVEAGVDFTDQEDVVPIPADELRGALEKLRSDLAARAAGPVFEAPPEGPLVVLAGEPNVGKTTLLNALLGRERSVVSPDPGSTRDVVIEPVSIRGATVRLADLAGLDPGARGADIGAQEQARRAIDEAALVIHCDPAGRFEPIAGAGRTLRVRTKADLVSSPAAAAAAQLGVCALDGHNLGALREAIADAALGSRDATPRRRRAIRAAAASLDEALETLAINSTPRAIDHPELVAGAMRTALDALGKLAGDVSPDEIIGRVFAGFCVGK